MDKQSLERVLRIYYKEHGHTQCSSDVIEILGQCIADEDEGNWPVCDEETAGDLENKYRMLEHIKGVISPLKDPKGHVSLYLAPQRVKLAVCGSVKPGEVTRVYDGPDEACPRVEYEWYPTEDDEPVLNSTEIDGLSCAEVQEILVAVCMAAQ